MGPMDNDLTQLENIIINERNKNAFRGGDLNDKSGMWLADRTNQMGSKVKQLNSGWNLQIFITRSE